MRLLAAISALALLFATSAKAQDAALAPDPVLVPVGDTLQSVLASVYNGNPRLLAERARLREIDETYIQARAQGRPVVSIGGDVSLQTVRTPATASSFFNPGGGGGWDEGVPQSAQISVVQPVYQGGRVKALKRQARASILAARAGLEGTENNIFLSASNAYVDIVRDLETANVRRNNVRVLVRQLTAANERFDVGEGTRTDIAQSESRLAAAEAGLAQAEAQLESSRALFVRIVGRMPVNLAPAPDFVLPASLDEAIGLARDNNPQLLTAYYNERAGTAAIDVAKAASRPTLSLNGSFASQRDTVLGVDEVDQATLAAQISIPIFSGGLNQSRIRQAKHAKTRLAFETRDTERAVDQTVAQIWAQMIAARRIVETSQRQVAAAAIAFEGVSLEQQVGTRTQLDVLNAEQETLNAQLNLLNAERDYDSSVFQLLATIGVLDADGIALPIDRHDPNAYLNDVAYDGFKEAGDRFVPEAAQKIGPQLLDIARMPVEAVGAASDYMELDVVGEGLLERAGQIGQVVKEGADRLTGQVPAYDPRITDPDIVIVTNPYGPGDPLGNPDSDLNLDREDVPDGLIDEHAESGPPRLVPDIPLAGE